MFGYLVLPPRNKSQTDFYDGKRVGTSLLRLCVVDLCAFAFNQPCGILGTDRVRQIYEVGVWLIEEIYRHLLLTFTIAKSIKKISNNKMRRALHVFYAFCT